MTMVASQEIEVSGLAGKLSRLDQRYPALICATTQHSALIDVAWSAQCYEHSASWLTILRRDGAQGVLRDANYIRVCTKQIP